MSCTLNTDSISLNISAGTLTANLILASGANGLSVSGSGVKAPTNVTTLVPNASVSGTSGAFTAGFNGVIGPTLLVPAVTNPSSDRTMEGLFLLRNIGENIQWSGGSIAVVTFQVSINAGVTWSTQGFHAYNNTPSGVLGYGGHFCSGTFGPLAGGATVAAGTVQCRMFMSCPTGGGTVLNSGDLDARLMLSNQ